MAFGPLSETSLVRGALLALSLPSSDDAALGLLSRHALGEDLASVFILSADLVLRGSPSFQDSGTLSVESLLFDAAGELLGSSLVNCALISVLGELLDSLVDGAWSDASGPLTVSFFENCAGLALAVNELLLDEFTDGPADLSRCLGRSPDGANVSAASESSDGLCALHNSSPIAAREVHSSTSGDSALLKASLESVNDLRVLDFCEFPGDASGPFLCAELSGLAISFVLLELLDELCLVWDLSLGH